MIDAAFLANTVDGRPRAKYQAVVLPGDSPAGVDAAELAAPASYEQSFAIPQVDAYTYARPQVGLDHPVNGGYSGPLVARAPAADPDPRSRSPAAGRLLGPAPGPHSGTAPAAAARYRLAVAARRADRRPRRRTGP